MEPIVFIDSLDNISIVNLNVSACLHSPAREEHESDAMFDHLDQLLRGHAHQSIESEENAHFEDAVHSFPFDFETHHAPLHDLDEEVLDEEESGDDEDCDEEENGEEDNYLKNNMNNNNSNNNTRRTTSSLEKVRQWKKYKNKKHLSQLELDRKRDLANKQERRRMHRLNDALNRLRQAIPVELQHPPRRLSKIKTLQSAIKYIKRLQELLRDN